MKDRLQTKAAVIDKSITLMKLRDIEELNNDCSMGIMPQTEIDETKDMVVQSICKIIEDLSKEYAMVIIPQTVVKKFYDAATPSTRQILSSVLSNCNVISEHYPGDYSIVDFAIIASKKFNRPVDVITYDDPSKQIKYTVAVKVF